jgi:hypothetical protein
MLVSSGDDDSICSAPGTQEWIWDLGAEPSVAWKPWEVSGQTAGFVTLLGLGKGGASNNGTATGPSLTFATVHGAVREVPAFRPMEALSMVAFWTAAGRSLCRRGRAAGRSVGVHTAPHGCSRLHTAAHGCTWVHTAAHGCMRLHMGAHGGRRLHTGDHGCTRVITAAHGCTINQTQ